MNWLFGVRVQYCQLGDQHLEDADGLLPAGGGDGVLEAGDQPLHLDHDLVEDQLVGDVV